MKRMLNFLGHVWAFVRLVMVGLELMRDHCDGF